MSGTCSGTMNVATPPNTGDVNISSVPSGAEIYIDGTDQYVTTPNTVKGLVEGSHTYTLTLAGYNNAQGTFTINGGQTTTLTVTLVPITSLKWKCSGPPGYTCAQAADGTFNSQAECQASCMAPATGNIKITTSVPGAEVFIDGGDQGIKTPITLTGVPIGSHNYTLKLDGFIDSTGTVLVQSGQTAEVSSQLIPGEGNIYFTTTVPGASIFIDTVNTGMVTPALIIGASLGVHTYRLVLPGYTDLSGSVTLGAGNGVTITGTLIPVTQGTPAQSNSSTAIMITLLSIGALGVIILSSNKK